MPADPLERIYLDHAAATPLDAAVEVAMREASATAFANPSSPHAAGRQARRVLEECRERVLGLVGGRAGGTRRDRLVFTGGATEANQFAIHGLARGGAGTLFSSARDHGSVTAALPALGDRGWSVRRVPLRPDLTLDLDSIAAAPTAGPAILATTLVCGQSGVIEDMERVAAAVAGSKPWAVHVDAVQALAYEEVDFARLPAATLALAPHKFGGPRGIGGLVVRGGVPLAALLPGPQEAGLRGGTEAVALAVGFARALEEAVARRQREAARIATLRAELERLARQAAAAAGLEAVVVGERSRRAPHIATIAFPGVERQTLVMAADLAGLCLATGTACASGSSDPAPALEAAGLAEAISRSAVRFSLGSGSTAEQVARAGARLADLLGRCKPA